MKGRMFVVDEKTIVTTKSSMIASIKTPSLTGKYWLKTISDIMADLLQIEIGDYIFLWETRNKSKKSRVHGVYRAISKPYYEKTSKNDNAPFKIHIEKAYEFEEALDEYDILNCPYIKNDLWTIIGKKVAGKSRGTSPLSQEDMKCLIMLLIGKNPNFVFNNFDKSRVISVSNSLNIDYTRYGDNVKPRNLYGLQPNKLNFFDKKYNVHFEKILETIFNQELSSTPRNKDLFMQLGINSDKIVWFCNYLPYSIEQSEMDYVIIESDDGFSYSKIFVIEFQKTKIDSDHISRCLLYSKWVNEKIALGTSMVQPILICNCSYDFINGETNGRKKRKLSELDNLSKTLEKNNKLKPLEVYEYDFSKSSPQFTKKR